MPSCAEGRRFCSPLAPFLAAGRTTVSELPTAMEALPVPDRDAPCGLPDIGSADLCFASFAKGAGGGGIAALSFGPLTLLCGFKRGERRGLDRGDAPALVGLLFVVVVLSSSKLSLDLRKRKRKKERVNPLGA